MNIKNVVITTNVKVSDIINGSAKLANTKESYNQHLYYLYYSGKLFFTLFLLSLIAWCARLYNHTRRLKIVYRDKALNANTYEKFLFFSNEKTREIVRMQAIQHIFSPTLNEVEKNKSNIDIENIAKLVASCKDINSK